MPTLIEILADRHRETREQARASRGTALVSEGFTHDANALADAIAYIDPASNRDLLLQAALLEYLIGEVAEEERPGSVPLQALARSIVSYLAKREDLGDDEVKALFRDVPLPAVENVGTLISPAIQATA